MQPLEYIVHQASWPEVDMCIKRDGFTVFIYGQTAEYI